MCVIFPTLFFLITIIRITRIWLSKVLISIVMMLGKRFFPNIKKKHRSSNSQTAFRQLN